MKSLSSLILRKSVLYFNFTLYAITGSFMWKPIFISKRINTSNIMSNFTIELMSKELDNTIKYQQILNFLNRLSSSKIQPLYSI